MSILSVGSNNLFSVGNCPEYPSFFEKKRRYYEQDPTAMDNDLRLLEERGIIKIKPNKKERLTLTLILKKGDQNIAEREIEGVDSLQTLFFLSLFDKVGENGCHQPCCELPCCILNRLKTILY